MKKKYSGLKVHHFHTTDVNDESIIKGMRNEKIYVLNKEVNEVHNSMHDFLFKQLNKPKTTTDLIVNLCVTFHLNEDEATSYVHTFLKENVELLDVSSFIKDNN